MLIIFEVLLKKKLENNIDIVAPKNADNVNDTNHANNDDNANHVNNATNANNANNANNGYQRKSKETNNKSR